MNPVDKTDMLRAIRDEVIELKDSSLYAYRVENKYHPVIGEGSHDARIMFVGEATAVKLGSKTPIAYHQGKYWSLNGNIGKPPQEERNNMQAVIEKHGK